MKEVVVRYALACTRAHVAVGSFLRNNANALMLVLGVVLLTGGVFGISVAVDDTLEQTFSEASYDDALIRGAVGNLFKFVEGAFGALIMVVAGLGAIVSAAMGAYRLAVSMLVVAVGAFILRALVTLFFGADYTDFSNDTGA